MAAICTEKLGKAYTGPFGGQTETNALKGLDLEVREGETFGFLGPNGAGKTTTILLLLNLIRPTSGSARLFDSPVTDHRVHRRLGYLPESVNLHDYYTGQGLLEFYAALLDLPPAGRKPRIAELLRWLRLDDAAAKSVSKYSKGMYSTQNPLYYLLPSFAPFNLFANIVNGSIMKGSDVLYLTLYALDFVVLMLLLAWWRFRTKEVC